MEQHASRKLTKSDEILNKCELTQELTINKKRLHTHNYHITRNTTFTTIT